MSEPLIPRDAVIVPVLCDLNKIIPPTPNSADALDHEGETTMTDNVISFEAKKRLLRAAGFKDDKLEQALAEVSQSVPFIVTDILVEAVATARKAGASDRQITRLMVLFGAAKLPGGWKEIQEMAASLSEMAEELKRDDPDD